MLWLTFILSVIALIMSLITLKINLDNKKKEDKK